MKIADQKKYNDEPGSSPGSVEFRWTIGICGALAVATLLLQAVDSDSPVSSKPTARDTRRPVENPALPRHGSGLLGLPSRPLRDGPDHPAPSGKELQTNMVELALSEVPNALAILQQLNDDEPAKDLCLRLI